MPDIHIDDFYRDTAKTLVALYNHFPRPLSLYVEDIAGPDTPDEFGLHSKRHESCLSAFIWLSNAGYLNYTSLIMREALEAATLTHDGFVLLNSELDGDQLNPKAPHGSEGLLINLLRRELESGTSGSLAVLVKGVMARKD